MTATPKLRAVAAMILNALDRDAADGKPVRREMAQALREALANEKPELVVGRPYTSTRGFGVMTYIGETNDIDGWLPTFRLQDGRTKAYSYDSLSSALEEFAREVEPECGNCFEGKSDMDHVCRKCGGSGKAEPAPAQDEQEFNTSDGDLTELLNIAADMVKGVGGGMDLGIYFVTVLERVEERLAARPAQTAQQPGQSEELAWKVLQAATDALDRRAAPHAWISQAWNAGSEVITSRRPVAGGRDE